MKNKILSICLALMLVFQAPGLAGAFTYDGNYTPPDKPLTAKEQIMNDANQFIREVYDYKEDGDTFFLDPYVKGDKNYNEIRLPLKAAKNYNISDLEEVMAFTAPMLYYYKDGGGPERDKQFLGQTKEGYTITNVRYPMVANWRFIEELDWCEVENINATDWWRSQGHDLPKITYFNKIINSDPGFARLIDACIGIAVLPQIRHWNGQQYYMSKAMAVNGNPGQPGQNITLKLEEAVNFPWHNYVHILMPPTHNTWGYGIGFYKYNGRYAYKSFPITPIKFAFMPDFYLTPEGSSEWQETYKSNAKTYTGKAGENITIPVTLHNQGEEDITYLACTWWGGGWENPIQHWKDINLAKGESKEFSVPVTVPQPGQENRLVFRANIDGKTPASELNQDNNLMVVTVQPEGVDIACMKFPQLTYKIKPGETLKLDIPITVTLNEPLDYNLKVPVNIKATQGFSYNKDTEVGICEGGYFHDIPITLSKAGV